jgi:glycerol-1-phosphate dehydrogenase [NAD(P)+]
MEHVELLRARIAARPSAVVALGSGSVCDVAKHACYLADRKDGVATTLVLVPTAVSVTAFTSSLAVLLVDGVKRTRASRFPDAVVCDLETLMDAPPAMLRAGLGDCCARFVSYGDWYLAHQLGLVDRYSETPLALMGEDLDELYLEQAEAIGAGRADGILFLTRQVLLAGLAQSAVNLSAPLSGTEHVVSHLLDMGAAAWGRPLALHGAQVGVATTIAARAYELLLERFDPRCPRPTPPSPESAEAAIRTAFLPLDPSGRMAEECWRDYGRKLARWTAQPAAFDAVRERWTTVVAPRLRQLVRPSETIRSILASAGHPLTFDGLEPPIPQDQARFALANAHLIRERFTVGDLFAFLDLGGEEFVEELLASTVS